MEKLTSKDSVVREEKLTAPVFVQRVKDMLVNAPDEMDFNKLSSLVYLLMELVESYDKQQAQDAIAIQGSVSEMVAKDKEVNEIGLKYNLTLNQVAGFKELCEQLNAQFRDTGVVVVPFWFLAQYQEMLAKINALNVQTDNLIETIETMKRRGPTVINMAERTSIITGHTMPYIPGETGPRIGDEHLDSGFDAHLFRN